MKLVPALLVIIVAGALLLTAPEAEGALDAVQLWNEDFTGQAKVIRDGAVVGITATDQNTTGGTRNASVSDPTNPGDAINVTLYDDGTHGDLTANDGIYTGNFTVKSDGGTSGSGTSQAGGAIDIAEGDAVSVYVDLDGDGSYSSVTVSTDYTGPGMATPFEGGFVSGDLIITITIISEGEAELDPGSVVYSVDSGPSVPFVLIAPNTWQAVIDTTQLKDGNHTLTTLSADEAGNVGTETIEFTVDNTVPDIIYQEADIQFNGDVEIPILVLDENLDPSTVRWRRDGGPWQYPGAINSSVSIFNISIPYDDMTPGNHSIEVTAKDLANNSMTYILKYNLPKQDYSYLSGYVYQDSNITFNLGRVLINLDAENEGEVPLDLYIGLYVDDVLVDSETTRLNANDTPETFVFEWPIEKYGTYDVDIIITDPNAPSGDEPVMILPFPGPGEGSYTFLPEPVTLEGTTPIDPTGKGIGDDIDIRTTVKNPINYSQNVTLHLVVNGLVVDTYSVEVGPGDTEDVLLKWRVSREGDNEIEIRTYMPDSYGMDEPVDTTTVVDITGSSTITIEPPDEVTDPIEGPLGFLNPLYDYFPFSYVPEGWRPWFLPLLLIGIILGIGMIGLGRRKRKKDELEDPETELKAVEMPPVTGDGAPVTSTIKPVVPVSLTAADPDDTGGTVVRDPDKPPATAPPPIVPPIASTTKDDDKGDPCEEIIRSQTRERKDVTDAQAAASDAKRKERDAQDEAETADRTAGDAERKANTAQKECDDAREEYEGHGVEEAEREAKDAEDRLKEMEDRMNELEGDMPEVDGVSLEPKPGYHHGGVGMSTMIHATSVYYRDSKAEIDLNRELKKRHKEYKKLKDGLEEAKEDAETQRKEAEEAAERAKDSKKRMEEACEKAKKAKEGSEGQRGAANDAQANATKMGADVKAANEAVTAEKGEADAGQGKADDCQDCLAKVRRTLARIEELKRRYESLKGGSAMKGPKGRHSRLDGHGVWDEYWNSFKELRDHSKALSEIKGFTDADLPAEFNGIFDWGGPVGTAVGYGAEDLVSAPIPTDSIKAVGGLYTILQAKLDPDMKEGATALHSHLESKEADAAARAFKRFPRALSNGVKGFEKLHEFRDLDVEISEGLDEWEECLGKLPGAPDTPEVDFDKLCYKQCLDKLKELEEAERKMRELVQRAEDCEPSGLDGKLNKANKLKGQLGNMGDSMDRTSKGLANYRKAMKASSGCYISTAAYGSPMAPELDTLRGFRDRVLLPTSPGKLLVDHYYRTAPDIAHRLETRTGDRETVRSTIGLAARLIHAREGKGPVTGALLSMATVGVYVVGSLQAWLLTRR